MSVATAAPASTIARATGRNVPAVLRQIEAELNLRFFERREAIEAILITLLARQHGFLLGPPGTAKSELLETVCKSIFGAKYWRVLLDKQMGKEEIWGQYDIQAYLKDGTWERDMRDTLADCHVCLLDEIGKSGPAVVNTMLTALNERFTKTTNGWVPINLVSAFAASNELLEPDLGAIYDRFPVRIVIDEIVEDGNFMGLLELAAGQRGGLPTTWTTVDLDDLLHAINVEVPAVFVPAGIMDSMRQIRTELRAEQIIPSGRRWAKAIDLLKAAAYLAGRDVVDDDDLAILRFVLWDTPEQRGPVDMCVLSHTSPTTKAALDLEAMLDEITAEIDSRKGQSVETRSQYGGEALYNSGEIETKLLEAIAEAEKMDRATARLESVKAQLHTVRVEIYVQCMGTPRDRAELMVP